MKPRIRKRDSVWICESTKHPMSNEWAFGVGPTPFHAYRDWAREMPKPGQVTILDGKVMAPGFWGRLFGS